jgi:hypothetical protein
MDKKEDVPDAALVEHGVEHAGPRAVPKTADVGKATF